MKKIETKKLSSYLTVTPAARFLECSPGHVRNLIKAKRLTPDGQNKRGALVFSKAQLLQLKTTGVKQKHRGGPKKNRPYSAAEVITTDPRHGLLELELAMGVMQAAMVKLGIPEITVRAEGWKPNAPVQPAAEAALH